MADIKVCIICGKELPKYRRVYCSDDCAKEGALKKRYDRYQNDSEHRKKDNERSRKYYQDNLERRLEYGLEYRQNNREKEKERSREYYQNNREEINKYYQNNRERKNENNRRYRQNNLEERREYDRKRYRLIRGLSEDVDLHEESGIEILMKEWLQEFNIKFVQEYYINLKNSTWTYVDFYIPKMNVCLYVDGKYWHSKPNVPERDLRISGELKEMGYRVIRLSEIEILNGIRPDLEKKLEV